MIDVGLGFGRSDFHVRDVVDTMPSPALGTMPSPALHMTLWCLLKSVAAHLLSFKELHELMLLCGDLWKGLLTNEKVKYKEVSGNLGCY